MALEKKLIYLHDTICESYAVTCIDMHFKSSAKTYILVPNTEQDRFDRDAKKHCDISILADETLFNIDIKTTKNGRNNVSMSKTVHDFIEKHKPQKLYIMRIENNGNVMNESKLYLLPAAIAVEECYQINPWDEYYLIPMKKFKENGHGIFDGNITQSWKNPYKPIFRNEQTGEIEEREYDFTPEQFKRIFAYIFDKCNEVAHNSSDIDDYINTYNKLSKEACEKYNYPKSVLSSINKFTKDIRHWR